jgi:cytolysin-activating lysine-acyltransferase
MMVPMPHPTFKIIAPALIPAAPDQTAPSEAEYFGSAAWLWMHSKNHRHIPLHALNDLLLPAIRLQQFVLVMEVLEQGSRPVAYFGWANLNAQAESRYISNPTAGLSPDDWNSGDRMWLTDYFAPFGNVVRIHKLLESVLCNVSARYLYHRSNERGVRVLTSTGANVDPAYARQWWRDRPMLASSKVV